VIPESRSPLPRTLSRDSWCVARGYGEGYGDNGEGIKDSGLRTQDSGLRTQDSGLRTQDTVRGLREAVVVVLREECFFSEFGFTTLRAPPVTFRMIEIL
jgi:hypothetical protein